MHLRNPRATPEDLEAYLAFGFFLLITQCYISFFYKSIKYLELSSYDGFLSAGRPKVFIRDLPGLGRRIKVSLS